MVALSEAVLFMIVVAWIAAFGLAAARMAKDLDRIQLVWFAIGAVLGPVALLTLRGAPPSRCRNCGTPTRGWARICRWCHEDVRLADASVVAMAARMSGQATDPEQPIATDRPRAPLPPPASMISAARTPPPARVETPAESRPPAKPPTETLVARLEGRITNPERTPNEAPKQIQRMRNRADESGERAPDAPPQVIATAVFVVGSARLEPGRRYSLAIRSNRLLVLGPVDVEPSAVALDRPVADVDAHAVDGRLVISEPRSGSGLALAFMAVAGATIEDVATLVAEAGRRASRFA